MNALLEKPGTVIPTEQDVRLATESSRILSKARPESDLRVRVDGQELVLPKAALRLMSHLLTEMSQGNAVTIFPVHAELTTQEAADYLNVSRPHLVHLLTTGAIRHRKVGTHRRIRFDDLQAYKEKKDQDRAAALDELAAEGQRLRLGY